MLHFSQDNSPDPIIWRKPEMDFCKHNEYMIWVSQENGHLGPGRQFYVVTIRFGMPLYSVMESREDIIANALSPLQGSKCPHQHITHEEQEEIEYILDLFTEISDQYNLINVPSIQSQIRSNEYIMWLDQDHTISIRLRGLSKHDYLSVGRITRGSESRNDLLDYMDLLNGGLKEDLEVFVNRLKAMGYTVRYDPLKLINIRMRMI